jgi:hypothetical protein
MPTPTTNPEAPNHGSNSKGPHNLKEVALTGWKPGMMWPTPQAHNAKETNAPNEYLRNTPSLTALVHLRSANENTAATEEGRNFWPTPRTPSGGPDNSSTQKRPSGHQGTTNLQGAVGGKLNPTWVEWLMGWPLGWTDLRPLATAKFLSWQQQHGVSLSEET